MRQTQPWSSWFAWVTVATASVMLLLALTNLIINTERIGSWLLLLILAPVLLQRAIWSLRHQDQRL